MDLELLISWLHILSIAGTSFSTRIFFFFLKFTENNAKTHNAVREVKKGKEQNNFITETRRVIEFIKTMLLWFIKFTFLCRASARLYSSIIIGLSSSFWLKFVKFSLLALTPSSTRVHLPHTFFHVWFSILCKIFFDFVSCTAHIYCENANELVRKSCVINFYFQWISNLTCNRNAAKNTDFFSELKPAEHTREQATLSSARWRWQRGRIYMLWKHCCCTAIERVASARRILRIINSAFHFLYKNCALRICIKTTHFIFNSLFSLFFTRRFWSFARLPLCRT